MIYADILNKRKEYKISQIKLSEVSGYSPAKISAWELGKETPSANDVNVLMKSLNQIIEDIVSGVFDIRKKRIQHSGFAKNNLPKAIKSKEEYISMLERRGTLLNNAYRESLTKLFNRANSNVKNNSPKGIALFSGCGGLSLGFEAAGFNLVGHLDIEESANRIYKANFPNSDLLGTDICNITDEQIHSWLNKYGDIDIIIGGPPCQGFSLAGKRDPTDMRNQLYKYYVHMVSVIHPKVFVMENVRLLTSMRTTEGTLFIDHIVQSFTNAGYRITRREINASAYGVPQSRERVILVGIRNDMKAPFTFPEGEYTKDIEHPSCLFTGKKELTFKDATSDLCSLESGEVSKDPLHWSITHPEHVIKWLKDVPEGQSAHDNEDPKLRPPSGFNTTYKRILWDEPCSTISTNFSMISGCRNVHPTDTRSLTIREATRAQSFPDEFVFIGKWGDIRKAIGNAVPPLLAEKIAKAIFQQYFSLDA
jgi:DNA (cytosine-5)-methyltransferase 1